MKHKFTGEIAGETEAYPYCRYVECIYCKDWFCDNGCDNSDEDCDEAFETLFKWEHLIVPRKYDF